MSIKKDLKAVHPAVAKAVTIALQAEQECRKAKRYKELAEKAREREYALYRKSEEQYRIASALGLDWAIYQIQEALHDGTVSEYLAELYRDSPADYAELVT